MASDDLAGFGERVLKERCVEIRLHVPFDRFPQRTIDWLSLPVLADPFWGRAAFPVTSRCGETASIRLVSAELRSDWTAEGGCPYADGLGARPHTSLRR